MIEFQNNRSTSCRKKPQIVEHENRVLGSVDASFETATAVHR